MKVTTKTRWGILALVFSLALSAGLVMTGCNIDPGPPPGGNNPGGNNPGNDFPGPPGGNNPSGVDSALNGTWRNSINPDIQWVFNNGYMERWGQGFPFYRGPYIISGNRLTLITTHMHGDSLNLFADFHVHLQSRWYSFDELIALGADARYFHDHYPPITLIYLLSGNTLVLTDDLGTSTWIRIN